MRLLPEAPGLRRALRGRLREESAGAGQTAAGRRCPECLLSRCGLRESLQWRYCSGRGSTCLLRLPAERQRRAIRRRRGGETQHGGEDEADAVRLGRRQRSVMTACRCCGLRAGRLRPGSLRRVRAMRRDSGCAAS